MRLLKTTAVALSALFLSLAAACSEQATESPFEYPYVKQLHIKDEPGKPYSGYGAFYLLTEDFEPDVDSASGIESMREVRLRTEL